MKFLVKLFNWGQNVLDILRGLDFLGPLALRLYLAPIFWMAGTKKLADMDSVIQWFGNAEWGLGLPYPEILAWAAALTETVGAVFLLIGFATRWISIPLMVTMVVAIFTVHLPHGWLAIAEGADSLFANARSIGGVERLEAARSLLQEHGNYEWLTEMGDFVVLNNGIEFAATYLIMLLVLFFIGAGKYFSVDYFLYRAWRRPYLEEKALKKVRVEPQIDRED